MIYGYAKNHLPKKVSDKLSKTEAIIICHYQNENFEDMCTNDNVIKKIENKSEINKFISLISNLKIVSKKNSFMTSDGRDYSIYLLGNNKIIMRLIYKPYLKLETSNTYYFFTSKYYEEIDRIIES